MPQWLYTWLAIGRLQPGIAPMSGDFSQQSRPLAKLSRVGFEPTTLCLKVRADPDEEDEEKR